MKNRPEVAIFRNARGGPAPEPQGHQQRTAASTQFVRLLPRRGNRRPPKNPYCSLSPQELRHHPATGTSPACSRTPSNSTRRPPTRSASISRINLRNRVVKADQFRAVACVRQRPDRPKSSSRRPFASTSATHSSLSCRRKPAWAAAQKKHAISRRTPLISPKKEQDIGKRCPRYDTLVAEEGLALAEFRVFYRADWPMKRPRRTLTALLGRPWTATAVSIDDAKNGVVTHMP